ADCREASTPVDLFGQRPLWFPHEANVRRVQRRSSAPSSACRTWRSPLPPQSCRFPALFRRRPPCSVVGRPVLSPDGPLHRRPRCTAAVLAYTFSPTFSAFSPTSPTTPRSFM